MLLQKMYLSIKVLFRVETMEAYKLWGGETKKKQSEIEAKKKILSIITLAVFRGILNFHCALSVG
jgi:hypothetical protein